MFGLAEGSGDCPFPSQGGQLTFGLDRPDTGKRGAAAAPSPKGSAMAEHGGGGVVPPRAFHASTALASTRWFYVDSRLRGNDDL